MFLRPLKHPLTVRVKAGILWINGFKGEGMAFNKTEALRQAEHFVLQGNVSSAITLYRQIIDADPFDLSSISALGDLFVKTNRTQDAVDYFSRISDSYLKKGSTNSATYLLTKILKLDPLNGQVYLKMGEIYLRDGLNEKAHDCFIEAGAAFWQKGSAGAASEANLKALKARPDSRQARAALAALREESQQSQAQPLPATLAGDFEPILISIADEAETKNDILSNRGSQAVEESTADFEYLASQRKPLAILEDDTIIRQISAAEMLVAYGRIDEAVAKLRDLLKQKPDDIEVRVKLKDVYLRGEKVDRASEECLNIAAIFAARGDSIRAKDFMIRAELLERTLEQPLAEARQNDDAEEDGLHPSSHCETPET
jgi:tetratricopeptide (TPR) repeat protein